MFLRPLFTEVVVVVVMSDIVRGIETPSSLSVYTLIVIIVTLLS